MEYDYMDVLRSTHPSKTQVEALLRMLEKNPALAKGHAKSLYGKQKMRKDWARIALTLNRISGGSTKNTQKWMKYWADKKSFVKKKLLKLSQLDRTGSAADEYEDNYQLSPIEGRIVKLISGEPFGKDNKHVEIKVFCKESNLDDSEPTFRLDTTKPVTLQSSQSTDNIGGLELVENITESQNMDTSAVDTLFMEAVKQEPSRVRTRSPVADRASPPPSLPSESDSPSPSPEPLLRRRERGRRKPYTIPKTTRRQRRRSASSSSERTHHTPLTSLTKKLLRIEEQKLKLDQKLFKTLEKVLESNAERERLLAQGAIALGEGLKAMAEVLKSRDGYNGLGNHEFDHGVEGLLPYLQNLNAPMLGANVNTTFEPSLTPYIKNHVIIERHGRMIGIIGVLLQVFSAPIGNVIMEDEVEAINREAAILTAQGVDIIIVLSHVGFSSDIAMASRISSDVDIIVGAHTHTLLYNGETPSGETPVSEYPTVVTQSNGHRIPIVQASCYTRYLGNIKFFIDDGGRVQSWEGLPIYLGTSIVQDPVMMAELEPWRVQVDAVGKEVLARSLVTLNRSWCGRGECNLGDWVCDMLLEEVMPFASGESWNYADVCLINAGGMRVQIDPGNVTTEGLLMALPFENLVQVYDLRGEHLLEALEFAVGVAQSEPGSFYSGRMLQVAGLRVVYNASAPIGSRVASAAVRCGRCGVPRYEPLDEQRVYKVLSQNYIGDGGGGYTMLSENRENLEELELDYVMLQRAMRRQTVIAPSLDGRIQIVY